MLIQRDTLKLSMSGQKPKRSVSERVSPKVPPPVDMFLKTPLYERFAFTKVASKAVSEIFSFGQPLDFYCEKCKAESVFRAESSRYLDSDEAIKDRVCSRTFKCARCSFEAIFIFRVSDLSISKIGQCPSMADLETPHLHKYRKILPEEKYKELARGIGLSAHGVGIGAIVYLRRILESLIEEAHEQARSRPGWDEAAYRESRMAEKIALLRNELPQFLVENTKIYGVLSKGVHELDEQECLDAFPVVKLAIELILDEQLAKAERERKVKAAAKSIQDLANKHD